MATEFGAESTAVNELSSSVSPTAGVVDQPVFTQGLSDIFSDVGKVMKAAKASRNTLAVSAFTKQQLMVADALEQGKIKSSAYAQTRMRKNLLDALDANPSLAKELVAAQSSILGIEGGAKIVAEGTEQEQAAKRRREQLVSNGLVAYDADEQTFRSADQAERVAVSATKRYQERTQTLDLELKGINLTSARRNELTAQKKAEAERFVSDNSEAEFYLVRNKFDDILKGEGSEAEKISAIKDYYTEWNAQVQGVLGNVDSDMRSALKSTFDMLQETYLEKASGAIGDAEVERRTKRAQSTAEAIALSDPRIARLATANKLFGSDGLAKVLSQGGSQDAMTAYMEFLAGSDPDNGNEAPSVFTNDKATKQGMNQYLNSLSDALIVGDEEKSASATTQMTNLLNSIEDDSGRIARDPKKAIALIDWLASPSFLKARQANPDAFGNLDGVINVLDQNYHDEVSGMIRQQFKENNIVIPTQGSMKETGERATTEVPTPEGVAVRSTASGMEFYSTDPENRSFTAKAAELNKSLKPIINNSLKAQAHLAGRTDYGKMWDSVSETMMGVSGGGGMDEAPGGDEGDDLSMEDFVFPAVSTGGLPQEVANDEPFLASVEELASKYELEPEVLLAVMDFETGGSFNPAQKNAAGSSGTGLIQFMAKTAKGLGTTTEKLSNLDRLGQMKYVEKYLDQYAGKIKGGKAQDVYMAVLFPRAIDKPDSYVLFREGTLAYKQNKGLDKSGDGTITKAEAAAKVVSLVGKHKKDAK